MLSGVYAEELKRHPIEEKSNLHHADLLSPIDTASLLYSIRHGSRKVAQFVTEVYFSGGLFERFFDRLYNVVF